LHLQFNFVGKILGPQGNTIKRLQEETGAKISVLGKGSMRDKAKVKESPVKTYIHIPGCCEKYWFSRRFRKDEIIKIQKQRQ